MHPNSVFPRWSLGKFFPSSELELELTASSQTYILKPLQRHAWITLNEKQSYLFTTTLIGLKVFIVRASFTNFFFNSQLRNEKVNWYEGCGHKSKICLDKLAAHTALALVHKWGKARRQSRKKCCLKLKFKLFWNFV